jgi:LacI family transcriptional regulator
MSPDLDAGALRANLPERLPVVLLNCKADCRTYESISIDNYTGAYAAARHLVELGHRRIGVIGGPERNHDARERLRGVEAALQDAGLSLPAELLVAGDFSEASGHAAALALLAEQPTGLFAANDSMAIGALSALQERGITVPRDMSVAGFDDIPIARFMSPPLTTVRVSIPELGERATRRLFEVLRGEGGQQRVQELLPTELVVRGSSATAPRP